MIRGQILFQLYSRRNMKNIFKKKYEKANQFEKLEGR